MSFFSFLIISLIIQNISPLPYCDVEQYCSDCEYCGYSYHDYCSCDFYDAFCMNSDRTEYFEPNFLLNYDGCLTTNKEYDYFEKVYDNEKKLSNFEEKLKSISSSKEPNSKQEKMIVKMLMKRKQMIIKIKNKH